MNRVARKTPIFLAIAASAALSIAAATAAETAAGAGVSFRNATEAPVHILARHGSEAKCHRRPEVAKLTIEAGQAAAVDSGDGSVCWCKVRSADSDSCVTDWIEAAAGAKLRVR